MPSSGERQMGGANRRLIDVFRQDRGLWMVLLLAATLRLGWALTVDPRTAHIIPLFDSSTYFLAAYDIWEGNGYRTVDGAPTAYFPPGYPFLLAPIVGIFGLVPAASLLNAAAGTLACAASWAIGVLVHGPRAGRMAALLLAILPGHVIATSAVMSDPIFASIIACLFVAYLHLRRRSRSSSSWRSEWGWLLLGAGLGGASLVRGPAVLMPAVLAVLIVFEHGLSRRSTVRVAVLVTGFAIAVAPWSLRNQRVMGAPIFVATAGAYSFFNAHNPLANGGQTFAMGKLRMELFPDVYELESPAFDVALERAQKAYAFEYIFTHPLEELRQVPLRLGRLHAGDHWAIKWIGTPDSPGGGRGAPVTMISKRVDPWIARSADAAYFALLALAAVGLVRCIRRDDPATWLVPASLLYFHLLHGFVFFGTPRFHTAFLPLLAVLGGVAIASFGRAEPAEEAQAHP